MRVYRGLVLAGLFAGCVLPTDRTQDLGDGEIHGAVKREDKSPAKGALVHVAGSDRVTRVDDAGAFVVRGLVPGTWVLSITEDDEGDGVAERAALVPVTLALAGIPRNLTDGCTGAPPQAVTSFLLGDVTLAPTVTLRGTVTLGAAASGDFARVVVWRDVDVGGEAHAGPIEGAAGVGADGSFAVAGIAPGPVHVAAFAFDPLEGADKPLFFGVADADAADANVAVTVDQSARTAADPTRQQTTPVQIDTQWNVPATPAVQLTLATFLAPDGDTEVLPPDGTGWDLDEQTHAFVLDAPIGVVDIAFESATDGAVGSTLRGAVVVPGVAVLGPLELPVLADPCVVDGGGRDCDHDGVPGLALPDNPDVVQQYHACAASCGAAFGADKAGAVCDGDGSDCDDDGDGQPDVTEPVQCLGPGRGTDLDGDGLCEPASDPFPSCADNDPATCPQAFAAPTPQY